MSSVQNVLQSKGGDQSVFTTPADATVLEALAILREKRIGVVIAIGEDGKVAGIMSERDVVRAIADSGASVLERKVSELMTRELVTCGRDDPLSSVMAKMSEGSFRHVPVVEDGKLCGMVSMTDVVRFRLAEVEDEAAHLRSYMSL